MLSRIYSALNYLNLFSALEFEEKVKITVFAYLNVYRLSCITYLLFNTRYSLYATRFYEIYLRKQSRNESAIC